MQGLPKLKERGGQRWKEGERGDGQGACREEKQDGGGRVTRRAARFSGV
jgi:hypothetical protein